MNKFLIAAVTALTIAASTSTSARESFSFGFSDPSGGVSVQFNSARHRHHRGAGQHWRGGRHHHPRGRHGHGHGNHRRGICNGRGRYGHGRDTCGPGGRSRVISRSHSGWQYAEPVEVCRRETRWVQVRHGRSYRETVRVCTTSFR